jgi:hypothetical protein
MSSTQIHRQRFIAYALMGYLDYLRRTNSADIHINSTFGGRGTIEPKMERAGVRQEVIDLVGLVDELELSLAMGDAEFEKHIAVVLGPVIRFLQEDCGPEHDLLTSVELLVETPLARRPNRIP